MSDALGALASAVKERRPRRIAQASIDVGQSALDLELRHRDPSAIDAGRFKLPAAADHAARLASLLRDVAQP